MAASVHRRAVGQGGLGSPATQLMRAVRRSLPISEGISTRRGAVSGRGCKGKTLLENWSSRLFLRSLVSISGLTLGAVALEVVTIQLQGVGTLNGHGCGRRHPAQNRDSSPPIRTLAMETAPESPHYPTSCPICGREASFDLILTNRKGVHATNTRSFAANEVLGYGRYCLHCQTGWTGDELLKLARTKGNELSGGQSPA